MKVVNKGSFNLIKNNSDVKQSENSSIQMLGNNNEIFIESRCSFKNLKIVIRGDNNKLHIKRGAWFLGGTMSIVNNSEVTIGERSSFGNRLEFVIESSVVSIGDDCMVAAGLIVRSSDTHGMYDLKTGKLINKPQNISIGDYVWCGKDVTVLKGASIAPCNVIETQSMVTGTTSSAKPFELWGGSPAKRLKKDVMWSKSAHLDSVTEDKYVVMYLNKYKDN